MSLACFDCAVVLEVSTKMTKIKSIARGTALSALGYGAFEILGAGINEVGGDDDQTNEKVGHAQWVRTFSTIGVFVNDYTLLQESDHD